MYRHSVLAGAILAAAVTTVSASCACAQEFTDSNVGTTPPQTGTVSQAHIHFGKSRDSGGILVFFCTNLTFSGTGPTP